MNIARFERTGYLDLYVLAGLGPDAAPALIELPGTIRSCLLTSLQGRLGDERSEWSFNLARDEARGLLEGPLPASQGALTC